MFTTFITIAIFLFLVTLTGVMHLGHLDIIIRQRVVSLKVTWIIAGLGITQWSFAWLVWGWQAMLILMGVTTVVYTIMSVAELNHHGMSFKDYVEHCMEVDYE